MSILHSFELLPRQTNSSKIIFQSQVISNWGNSGFWQNYHYMYICDRI